MKTLILTIAAASLLTACGTTRDMAVRPIASALAAGHQPAAFRVAEANGHLRLGNVALALEGFRKASREDPASTEALVGMARCYDLMGRVDLSRVSFEKALALQPRNPAILTAFAASLTSAGATEQAARLRGELADEGSPRPPAKLSVADSILAVSKAGASHLTAGGIRVWAPLVAPVDQATASRHGPRLERTNFAEMMLVTSKTPQWKPLPPLAFRSPAPRAGITSSPAAPLPVRITILNAGSVEGTAARARVRLQQLGWSGIAIANAARTLDRSEVQYPAALAREGKRLARQLQVPVQARQTETLDRIVIRLGRDVPADKQT